MTPGQIIQQCYRFHPLYLTTPEREIVKATLPAILARAGIPDHPFAVSEQSELTHRESIEAAVEALTECSQRGALGPILCVPGAIIFAELTGFVGVVPDQVIVPAGGPLRKMSNG
jgi:hypothetical protein